MKKGSSSSIMDSTSRSAQDSPSQNQAVSRSACCKEWQNLYTEALQRLQICDARFFDQVLYLDQAQKQIGELRMAHNFQYLQNQYLLKHIEEQSRSLRMQSQRAEYFENQVRMLTCPEQVNVGSAPSTLPPVNVTSTPSNVLLPKGNIGQLEVATGMMGPTAAGILPKINEFQGGMATSAGFNIMEDDQDIEIDVVSINTSSPTSSLSSAQSPISISTATCYPSIVSSFTPSSTCVTSSFSTSFPTIPIIPLGVMNTHGRNHQAISASDQVIDLTKRPALKKKDKCSVSSIDPSTLKWIPFNHSKVDPNTPRGPASVSGYAIVKVDMVQSSSSKVSSQQQQQQRKINHCNYVARIKEEAVIEDGQRVFSVEYMKKKKNMMTKDNYNAFSTAPCFVPDPLSNDYLCLEEDVVLYLPEPSQDRRGKVFFHGVELAPFRVYQ